MASTARILRSITHHRASRSGIQRLGLGRRGRDRGVYNPPSRPVQRPPLTTYYSSSIMTDITTLAPIPATSDWLAQNLAELLSLPYIHFSTPKFGIPGLRLGHGPIDLFSTRFANLFTSEA